MGRARCLQWRLGVADTKNGSTSRVRDSFIPNKRRSGSNSKFGIISFELMGEAWAAIRRCNGVFCLNSKISVKLARLGLESIMLKSGTEWHNKSFDKKNNFNEIWKPIDGSVPKRS
ncbi:hypothetical protein L1049_022431 [Liquidambar formosana]|uniref:Uncharacterized protein n=1 Tax=Liquidambar formosana TaxID=63359 RepID=A0AAP0WRA8_LIQFO